MDSKFVLAVVIVIALIIGSGVYVNINDNRAMAEMVSHGSNPIDARCAIKGSLGAESTCHDRSLLNHNPTTIPQ